MARRTQISSAEARRIAFAAQGFDRPRPANPTDARHFQRTLQNITVLQLDFVNVLMPAHFFMVWSRLGAYDRARFEKWLYSCGRFTEQWAHEASIVAHEDWPLLRYRRDQFAPHKRSPLHTLPDRDAYLADALQRIREQGGLTANDLPTIPRKKGKPGDWHRPMSRLALDYHFGRGSVAVRRRLENFQRVYDLPVRLIADEHLDRRIEKTDAQRELVKKSAAALGVATCQDIADYYRMTPTEIRPFIDELAEAGTLTEVRVEGWQETAWLHAGARSPRNIPGASLLSPFDPMVWFRPRAERLFDFEYRIEIYVPAAKRRWGYYVLPFREGDRVTARVDLKADRSESALLVQAAFCEGCAKPADTAPALAAELRRLADWLELERVTIKKASAFDKALASELRQVR
ncbi:MAG: crosslink repair DNA glycosylase YcaQ family protein [Pseudomonadota bacterium]